MKIVNGLRGVRNKPNRLVTIGSFDGIHLGHQRILHRMKREKGGLVTVLTFEPHPQSIVQPDVPPPPQLTTLEERIDIFRSIGVKELILAHFDQAFAALSAEDFVQNILVDCLRVSKVFVGPNHQFGKGRVGDVKLLRKLGQQAGFGVDVVEPIVRRGEVISSSRIRRRLLAGEALIGMQYLNRPYYIAGEVVHGEGRGRKLGFPTANFGGLEAGKLEPPPGIYATITELDGRRWPSVSHFGSRPTFPGIPAAIETHIIGFDEDIYGCHLRVGLVDRIRGTVAFDSVAELIAQMNLDRCEAVERLRSAGFGERARRKSRRLGYI